jgi:hypothetical protein
MAADATLTTKLDALIGLFNRKGMDLPDRLFDKRTQFVLNGAPFETLLGQPSTDPLVLMIARGPAGYRFAMKGLQHAIPDARVERGELDETLVDGVRRVTGQLWLGGHVRGSGTAIDTVIDVSLDVADAGTVVMAAVTVAEPALNEIRAARLRP